MGNNSYRIGGFELNGGKRTRLKGKYSIYGTGENVAFFNLYVSNTHELPSTIKSVHVGDEDLAGHLESKYKYDINSRFSVKNTKAIDFGSKVKIQPRSQMFGDYKVYGVSDDDLLNHTLTVKQIDHLPSKVTPRLKDESDIYAKFEHKVTTDLNTVISIKRAYDDDSNGKLTVNPKTIMEGIYEVIEPPLTEYVTSSNKDTYVRKSRPRVNFGKDPYVVMGNNYGDSYSTAIQYPINGIAPHVLVKEAYIEFYNIDYSLNLEVDLYAMTEDWNEMSLTWMNFTNYGEKIGTITLGHSGEGRVDIIDLVEEWVKGDRPNYGIALVPKSEDINSTKTFISHDSTDADRAHRLVIKYRDPFVHSFNATHRSGKFIVAPYKDLGGRVSPKPVWHTADQKGKVEVASAAGDLNASLKVSNRYLEGSLLVKRYGESELRGSIEMYFYGDDDLANGEFTVESAKVDLGFGLYVSNRFNTKSMVNVPYVEYLDTLSKLTVTSFNDNTANVDVREHLGLLSKVASKVTTINDKLKGKVNIRGNEDIKVNLTAAKYNDIDFNVTVPAYGALNTMSTIKVRTYYDLPSKLDVEYKTLLLAKIENRAAGYADLEPTILAKKHENVGSKVDVRKTVDTLASVIARVGADADVPFKFTATHFHDLLTQVNVFPYVDVPSKVGVRVAEVQGYRGKVDVRVWEDTVSNVTVNEMLDIQSKVTALVSDFRHIASQVDVRVWQDLSTKLTVEEVFDTPSTVSPRVEGLGSTTATITSTVWEDVSTDITVMETLDTKATVTPRLHSVEDTQSTLTSKVWKDLESYVTVKEVLNLPSKITPMFDGQDEVKGVLLSKVWRDLSYQIEVKEHSNLRAKLTPMFDGNSDLAGNILAKRVLNLRSVMRVARYGNHNSLKPRISVSREDKSELATTVDVRELIELQGSVTPILSVDNDKLKLKFTYRAVTYKDLPSVINIRANDTLDLDVTIGAIEIKTKGYVFIM